MGSKKLERSPAAKPIQTKNCSDSCLSVHLSVAGQGDHFLTTSTMVLADADEDDVIIDRNLDPKQSTKVQ